MTIKTCIVFGVSGIAGRNLAEHLVSRDLEVIGVSRHPPAGLSGIEHRSCDLNNPDDVRQALQGLGPISCAFYATWSRQANEHANCLANGAMFRNAIHAVAELGGLQHVALVTGTKQYLGSFDSYAATELVTPFTEGQPRVPGENFYYVQEDILFDAAGRFGFHWSVARPHTIIGYAPGNAMNLGTSLAVFATLCRETGRPFRFPGSPEQYGFLTDMTDARLLARHLAWEALEPKARNQAFNVVNGDVFRWKHMWPAIAAYFDLEPAEYRGQAEPLVRQLGDAHGDWDALVKRRNLRAFGLPEIAPLWHVDGDLGRTQECVNDMSLSRELGFTEYQRTADAFHDLFDRLRRERVIP
jgi:nucleoside-diphosphate-sugar epimerase